LLQCSTELKGNLRSGMRRPIGRRVQYRSMAGPPIRAGERAPGVQRSLPIHKCREQRPIPCPALLLWVQVCIDPESISDNVRCFGRNGSGVLAFHSTSFLLLVHCKMPLGQLSVSPTSVRRKQRYSVLVPEAWLGYVMLLQSQNVCQEQVC